MKAAQPRHYLGFDLGATSGRAVLGRLHQGRLTIEEIHRFANGPVDLAGTLHWNFPGLWQNLVGALRLASQHVGGNLAGIGVDTWGVDFGLLGRDGQLLGNPLCYRDKITAGTVAIIQRQVGSDRLYALTGIAPGRITSLAQLVGLRRQTGGEQLRHAATLLLMPDLCRYFLCGQRAIEITAAGSTALADVRTRRWSEPVLRAFDLPRGLLPPLVRPGTVAGRLRPELAATAGLGPTPVIAVAGHDTLSAAAAAPITDDETVFISCGTWLVLGLLRREPLTTPAARRAGFVNELAAEGVLLARNMTGLYLFESLRRTMARQGRPVSYAQLIRGAAAARPFAREIDGNAPEFFATDNPLDALAGFLRRTGQRPLAGCYPAARVLLEGVAWNARRALQDLTHLTSYAPRRICLVGGGSRNRFLCQAIADATGLPVAAGPAEATVAGNLGLQALADGAVAGLAGVRALVRASFPPRHHRPRDTRAWDRAEAG